MPANSDNSTPWLFVGLGNPERKYAANRHNVGFHVLERLAAKTGVSIADRRYEGLFGKATVGQRPVLLLKPTTFMNASGKAVVKAANFYKVAREQIVVVYDDIDLEFARLRIRLGGSHGGHRGVESVIDELGTRDFVRLRIGVGRPPAGMDPIAHVLSNFAPEEEPDIEKTIEKTVEAALSLVAEGLEKTMTLFNSRPKAPAQPKSGKEPEQANAPVEATDSES
jgi:PTH1 family peptidyl-tRNA hydrolase